MNNNGEIRQNELFGESLEKTKNGGKDRLIDFLTGKEIRANKEEVESVQPLLRKLVNQLGYDKKRIRATASPHRLKQSPGSSITYPLDIAIFKDEKHNPNEVEIICECKKNDRKDGLEQLKIYMGLCPVAKIGIWSNGQEDIILVRSKNNSTEYQEIPYIPNSNLDLNNLNTEVYKKDLRPNVDLKEKLNQIRNYLAGSETGITLDAKFTEQIINLILCKIYDEREHGPNDPVDFYANIDESPSDTFIRISKLFKHVKETYQDVFDTSDKIELTPQSLKYCIQVLQEISLEKSARDAIGDAFEVFIGPTLRGDKGQFFTPKNVVDFTTQMIAPQKNDRVLDPACGAGGFLVSTLSYMWGNLEALGAKNNWTAAVLEQEKQKVAINIYGLEKDSFLTKIVKAYMAIMGDGKGGIFCQNTLLSNSDYEQKVKDRFNFKEDPFLFDCILANPPYGKEIKILDTSILSLYKLAQKHDQKSLVSTGKLNESRTPQVLFIEKIVEFLRENGRAGIVLPESMFGNKNDRYIIKYLFDNVKIDGIVSLPVETFMPSTPVKTCVLYISKAPKLELTKDYDIFMSKVLYIGHDKDNKTIYKPDGTVNDELPKVIKKFHEFKNDGYIKKSNRLGFATKKSEIFDYTLAPHFYDHQVNYAPDVNYKTLEELVNEGVVTIGKGMEIGSVNYTATGVPFVRTSDIGNFEINYKTTKYMSRDFYDGIIESYENKPTKEASLVCPNDILFVVDGQPDSHKGSGLMGQTALVLPSYGEMIIQSHVKFFRIRKNDYGITPHNFMYLINEPIVKEQIKKLNKVEGGLSGLNSRLYHIKIRIPNEIELGLIDNKMQILFERKEEALSLSRSMFTNDFIAIPDDDDNQNIDSEIQKRPKP